MRHLAAGKPLTAACNPLIEAFHALNQSHAPQDEAMLVRLYPFLCSRQVQQAMREMAASAGDARAAVAVDRLARRFESRAEGKRTD